MNRDGKSGKEYSKHISMELTADSARVTNLSLEGSRLVLTIEAELADSQLRSTNADLPPGQKTTTTTPDNAQSTPPPHSANAPHLGLAQPDTDTNAFNLGSENLPPPSAAFMPGQMDESPLGTLSPAASQSMPVNPDDMLESEPAVGPTLFNGTDAQETIHRQETPPALPEPDILTETPIVRPRKDEPAIPASGLGLASPSPVQTLTSTGPVVPPPLPVQESAQEKQIDTPTPWQAPELTSEDSAKDVTHFATTDGTTPSDDAKPEPEMTEPSILESLSNEELTLSEESSVIGGVRHGEPQPSISFGQDTSDLSVHKDKDEDKTKPAATAHSSEPTEPEAQKPREQTEKPQDKPSVAPQPKPDEAKPAEEKEKENTQPEKPSAPGGGTTVLIRYTCPKCKTQGMQAVDKVGTVVNCSNCGKAMRLVMKK